MKISRIFITQRRPVHPRFLFQVLVSDEEEMWRAQYGQAIHLEKEQPPDHPVADLWDWSMVTETKKSRKRKICRLVGRLIKRSSKLHPSMPSSGRVLNTAPICEVRLDLVRVRSGRVYKLRSPKVAYLSSYDSWNPTKDLGFPELSMEKETQTLAKSSQHMEPKLVPSSNEKKDHEYRDRAAERTLHGGFGVGPGQKKSADDDSSTALNISFGVGSYARRMLEKMSWKEIKVIGNFIAVSCKTVHLGYAQNKPVKFDNFAINETGQNGLKLPSLLSGEALGSSMKGLTEPLQLETKEVRVWDGIRIENGSMPDLNQTISALYRSRSLQAAHGLSCWHSLKL